MFKRNRTEVLINTSIWDNTMRDVVSIELVEKLIALRNKGIERECMPCKLYKVCEPSNGQL